jgi:SAM-dependent methyltransferase
VDEAEDPVELAPAESFDAAYGAVEHSRTLRAIWSAAYGADYPHEADPFSFVTQTDLQTIAGELRVGPGQRFADLACGRGGPGAWVAHRTGAKLIGIDFSPVAIAQARERSGDSGASEFIVAEAANTGLSSAAVDAVMSIDAFWLFDAKEHVAAEIARILRPEGRLVFTTWECHFTPQGWPPQLAHHDDLLQRAGFDIEIYEETPDWRARQLAVYAGILAAEPELAAEIGLEATAGLVAEAHEFPSVLAHSRRVLIVAQLRPDRT